MLDRRMIKADVKGILGGESRGSVFLATLLIFVVIVAYFAGVWGISHFYPIEQVDITSIENMLKQPVAAPDAAQTAAVTEPATDVLTQAQGQFDNVIKMLTPVWEATSTSLTNAGIIMGWATLLELLIMLPLGIGIQKFMLRVIRLKNPGAGTVFKGYGASYFFRSLLLPIWEGLCMMGWQIVMGILLCGAVAGTALATGLRAQDLALGGESAVNTLMTLVSGEYISKFGWIYVVLFCAWELLSSWLMLFKSISYSFGGMALAERPQIGVRKALRASRKIARRNHFRLFVTEISFIGWYLLAELVLVLVIAVGIGLNMLNLGQLGLIITLALFAVAVLLVMYLLIPYRVGVHAQCYVTLKREALDCGVVCREDFRGKRELRAASDQ